MRFPTEEQAREAMQRGISDALADKGREAAPWPVRADDDVTACLGICYQRGWSYGIQIEVQRRYGDLSHELSHTARQGGSEDATNGEP